MTDRSILMWANQDPKYPNSFIISKDNQRLLGLTRTDKNGQTYWKFKERKIDSDILSETKNKPELQTKKPESSPVMDNVQKFYQRQAQTAASNNHESQQSNITETSQQSH